MRLLFLNILDGCDDKTRLDKIINFVKKENPDILGLSELNHWQENKFQKLNIFKDRVGFGHSIFCEAKTGYNIALFSKKKLLSSMTMTDGMWHGLIVARGQFGNEDITFILTHLSPKDEDMRMKEVDVIRKYCNTEKVILFGDLNSLSSKDTYSKLVIDKIKSRDFKKFGEGVLRRDVINKIENLGFFDSIRKFSQRSEYSVPTPAINDASHNDASHFARFRLDYIFTKNLTQNLTRTEIIRNKVTDELSDHYPIVAEFKF